MNDYDVYAPDEVPWELREEVVPEATGIDSWCVLIEVATARDEHPPSRVIVVEEDFAERSEAMVAARRQAFEFRPPDPAMPRLRQVFEDDDGFLTIIDGVVSTFHFRTRVMKLAGVV